MIKQIRTSKVTRVVSCYLALMIILEMLQPMVAYALTGGPGQPEFSAFTPIGTSDMVDLSSGDFNYNIPVMDVGGYPLNLAYNSGATMDDEASWVGLGWDMNVGQINRNMRGIPDDFNGDKMVYENNMKPNTTIGGNVNIFISPFGVLENLISVGMGVKYNNYNGFGFSINGGLSYQISDNLSVGMNLESSSDEGVTVSPSVSMHGKFSDKSNSDHTLGASVGVSMNSRKGVETVTMSATRSKQDKKKEGDKLVNDGKKRSGSLGGGSLSLVDASFTPTKRVGMSSSNVMFSVNVEGAVFGIDPGVKFSGYRNSQGIKSSEKYKQESSFGYQHTQNATVRDVVDFNREKDRTVTKNTVSLPLTNYTYDLYSVQGQGVGGQFRPYRSQVGFIFDNYTQDDSFGSSLGGEIGAGVGTHFGFDGAVTDSESSTGMWTSGNAALYRVAEKTANKPNYEKVYFKNVGGLTVDREESGGVGLFKHALGSYDPITFKVNGGKFSRGLESMYYNKLLNQTKPLYANGMPLARNQYRLSRTQFVQMLTRKEATRYGFKTKFSPYSKKGKHDHHTSEIRILKDGGEHYIYGRAAYNSTKREVTFDVGTTPDGNCKTGLVSYGPGDNTPGNSQGGDQYFNRITTPAYAHTYLLTSVLSSDYQDISNDGPTDDDLGGYTKFSYTSKNKTTPYKWRVPYDAFKANYDEGLRSIKKDNKGNYQYGEKELLYINKIETKTHVAIFSISKRKDGFGVKDENGGMDTSESSAMWKLEKISLYSKPEYLANPEQAVPIKEAHFVYDYSLCPGIKNNSGENATAPAETANQGGKLTLKKVYFTYGNSNMGKYTPYSFNYDQTTNYAYDQKGYDMWGNYKPTDPLVGCETQNKNLSNSEYPYVEQNKENADKYSAAWLLRSIDLPSGGQLEVNYESDEYQFVQNREVMRMFKIAGLGNASMMPSGDFSGAVYGRKYAYLELDGVNPGFVAGNHTLNKSLFYDHYLKGLGDKPVYFRCMLNMTDPNVSEPDKYDYVTGYLDLNNPKVDCAAFRHTNGKWYGAVPMKMVDGTGGITNLSPIAKAGFYFGSQYLNNVVYSLTGNEDVNDIKGVVLSLATLVPNLLNIFRSPDGQLIDKHIASDMVTEKGWMRLMHPQKRKLGGGSRVRELKIHDRWDVMTNHLGQEVYKQFYGQIYSYNKEDGTSSGVATYEPLSGKENPFVEPFYDRAHRKVLLGPDTQNYIELPLGESFFPSPKVTYSRVTVQNLPRTKNNEQSSERISLKRHATGHIVNEFFTSFDYPTVTDMTILDPKFDPSPLGSILNIYARTHLSMAQGFSVHTNDMDGKPKAEWVFAEGQTTPISGMEYKYDQNTGPGATTNSGKLNNEVNTIEPDGTIKKAIVGVDYDVVNDFRENNSTTETAGIHFNTEGLPLLLVFVIVPVPLPSYSYHENVLRTAVTTKVVHTTAILRETVAYDLGSKVSTRNLAWDSETGDILLTETINEFNDKYYSMKFPAYWAYKGMGQSANNLGLEWKIEKVPSSSLRYKFKTVNGIAANAGTYLANGDVLYVTSKINKKGFKAWVVDADATSFRLIDNLGIRIPVESISTEGADIKVIRSSFRNMPTASMASVTSMRNPLYNYNNATNLPTTAKTNIGPQPYTSGNWEEFRVVNASAIEYLDVWPSQCECGLPKMKYNPDHTPKFEFNNLSSTDDVDVIASRSYNPYIYNVLGNWRPVQSYAYLTGRTTDPNGKPNPRRDGFFADFGSFYSYANGKWSKDAVSGPKWTSASEVSKYGAYGQEIENKDALGRYSSAMYGYNNRFAVAVSSNSKSTEQAFDGFEDYDFSECAKNTHFSFKEKLKAHKISITDRQSHTGKRSIRIEPGMALTDTIAIRKKVSPCSTSSGRPGTVPAGTKSAETKSVEGKSAEAKTDSAKKAVEQKIKAAPSKTTAYNGTTNKNKK